MDPASVPPVPEHVELVIYSYFLVVAAIGCYLHGRLRRHTRPTDEHAEDGSGLES